MEGPSSLAYTRALVRGQKTEVPDRLTLVLGGALSGKSRHAERLATALPPPWTYIATAQPLDEEMGARITAHRARRDAGWTTVEAPLDLAGAIGAAGNGPVLVDCLTLWVNNLMYEAQRRGQDMDEERMELQTERVLAACAAHDGTL